MHRWDGDGSEDEEVYGSPNLEAYCQTAGELQTTERVKWMARQRISSNVFVFAYIILL